MDAMIGMLPGGYWDECGLLHREAELSPLTGREEELLCGSGRGSVAGRVTALLSRCVRRIGAHAPVTPDIARNLLVADRQYLLLRLREVTFGERVAAVVPCPWPDCGSRIDLDFSTREIPVTEAADRGPLYTLELSDAAVSTCTGNAFRHVIFRLPTGADQEAVVPLVEENEAEALSVLLGRCVTGVDGATHPGSTPVELFSPRVRLEIEQAMARVAPRVDLDMQGLCPECGREFSMPFDIQDFFFGELRINRELLYREIHYLAYHYHWGEREIMEMPRERRRAYIDVLSDEIERLNNAVAR